MSNEALVAHARNREALCLYAWHPTCNNARLSRGSPRITVPTLLLWGPATGSATPAYGGARLHRAHPRRSLRAHRGRRATIPNRAARRVRVGRVRAFRRRDPGGSMQGWYLNENPLPLRAASARRRRIGPRSLHKVRDPKVGGGPVPEALDEYLLSTTSGSRGVRTSTSPASTALFFFRREPAHPRILARPRPGERRILSLGTLITVPTTRFASAEEYATADVISRGRLEIGFVKSGGSEMASGNATPIGIVDPVLGGDRISSMKTLAHRDGPFTGRAITSRTVTSLWPGPVSSRIRLCWAANGRSRHVGRVSAGGASSRDVFRRQRLEETVRSCGA